ncbi:unnamed protein product, partial [marine sediment metagenome]
TTSHLTNEVSTSQRMHCLSAEPSAFQGMQMLSESS